MGLEVGGLVPLLQVFDMPESIRFYCGLLGFALINQSGPGDRFGWALLRLGTTELMLNTAYEDDERPHAPDQTRIAAHSDTGLYFNCPDVEGAYKYLQAKGVKVAKPNVTHYGMKQLTLIDPDGYHLIFHWPATN